MTKRVGRWTVAVCLWGSATFAAAEPAIRVTSACERRGFEGWLEEAEVRVFFQACETKDGGIAVVSRPGRGRRLIELTRVERVGERLDLRVGSVAISESIPPRDVAAVLAALSSPELRLAGRSLWQGLASAGISRSSHPVELAAVAATLALVEAGTVTSDPDDDPDCMGCCGPGCDGCTGCYTQACYEHDRCVADAIKAGSWSPQMRCLHLLMAAAASAWECVK